VTAVELVKKKLEMLRERVQGPILGVDPGAHTGWAKYIGGGNWVHGVTRKLTELENIVDDVGFVIVEEFILMPSKMRRATKEMITPLKVLGVLEFLCLKENVELITVTPANRAMVKKLAEEVVGVKLPKHTREAAEVVVSYTVKLIEKGEI